MTNFADGFDGNNRVLRVLLGSVKQHDEKNFEINQSTRERQ